MKAVHAIAFILVIVGALNWLLVAFNWNLVDAILGTGSIAAKVVYVLVGVSAILLLVTHKKDCKCCDKTAAPTAAPMA